MAQAGTSCSKKMKQKIFITLSFLIIVFGLSLDTRFNIETADAYNATVDNLFSFPGSTTQYLRADGTWQTLNPAAMGVPSGTSDQYFDGTLALQTFPPIPLPQVQSDWSDSSSTAIDFIKNKPIAPYKSYQGIISQSGTSAPSVTIGNNDFGTTTLTWSRLGTGSYRVTASTAIFTSGKTVIIISDPANAFVNYTATVNSTTTATITTSQLSVVSLLLSAAGTDSLLANILVEIRVYN